MKKQITMALSIFGLLIFLALKHQQIFSAPGKEPSSTITIKSTPEPVKKPLEIEGIIGEYDRWLDTEIKNSGTVGAAVAIVYKNQIAYMKCYGLKKAGENDSINKNTVFRLASVSKTITGVLAGILDDEKIINLDDKVIDYLPGFKLKKPESTSGMTVRNLLSHTTGLIPHAYDNMIEEHVPMKKIIGFLPAVDISADPGLLYSYQNVMFSLLDTIITVKTSKRYSDLVRIKIFMPFGMKDASSDFRSFKYNTNKAFPHAGGNGIYRPLRLNDRYYNTAPAAGVNASISDMANFLLGLLNYKDPVLNDHVLQTVFTSQILSPLSRGYLCHWDNPCSKHYAIGWRIIGYKGREIAFHGGYVQGYRTAIALCQEENTGIVYLSNSPNNIASKSIPEFLNLLFQFQDNRKIITSLPQ